MPENHPFEGGVQGPDGHESIVLVSPSRQLAVHGAPDWIGGQRMYAQGKEMRLRDLWDILARRKAIVFATLLLCTLAGALICAFGTRRYMATAELQVGRENENNLGLQTDGSQEPPADALAEDVMLQTQARILQSDTLALKVINDLSLESTQDFRPKFSVRGYVLGFFAAPGPPDPSHATLEESPAQSTGIGSVQR